MYVHILNTLGCVAAKWVSLGEGWRFVWGSEVRWENARANLTMFVVIWRFAKLESPTRLIINSNSSGLIPGYTVSILVWGQQDHCYNTIMSVARRVVMRTGMFLIQPSVQVMSARCVFAGPIKRLSPGVSFTQSRSWCSDGPVAERDEVRLHRLDGEDNGRCNN